MSMNGLLVWRLDLALLGALLSLLPCQQIGAQGDDKAKDATTDAIYSSAGPTAWEVARDSERPWRVRTIATCAATFQWALPREGWGGAVRDRLRAYSRGTPEATMADRLLILEFALVRARATLP